MSPHWLPHERIETPRVVLEGADGLVAPMFIGEWAVAEMSWISADWGVLAAAANDDARP